MRRAQAATSEEESKDELKQYSQNPAGPAARAPAPHGGSDRAGAPVAPSYRVSTHPAGGQL